MSTSSPPPARRRSGAPRRAPSDAARRAALLTTVALAAGAGTAAGQRPTPTGSPAATGTGATTTATEPWSRPGPAVSGRDLGVLGGVTAAALALMSVDGRIARWSQRDALQRPTAPHHVAAVVRTIGDPGVLGIGGVTYLVGLARRDRATADVGLHTTEAVVASGVLTGVLKVLAGRARPYVTGDTLPHSFSLGRGLGHGNAYQAFPSGHATAAFAFAAALSGEGRHRWPGTNRVTEPLAYAGASLVALSRVYDDRHWASDVVMGAGIGFLTGRALVRYQHARPANAADGRLLPRRATMAAVPTAPATIGWSVAF